MPVKELLMHKPFDLDLSQKTPILQKCVKEELNFHFENNELFRRFSYKKGFKVESAIESNWQNVPYIPAQSFKILGPQLLSVSEKQFKTCLQSSATSGEPSTVLIDNDTSRRQVKVMTKVLGDFIGMNRRPFLIMDIAPNSSKKDALGAREAAIRGFLNFSSEAKYFMDINATGGLFLQKTLLEEAIQNYKGPEELIIFGFTYVLYFSVIKEFQKSNIRFQLPDNSKVIHIGGWKKLESQKVSKEVFNQNTAEIFGVSPQNVIDIYGFTEQMGLVYPDCEYGFKHSSIYSEVLIRDPENHNLLKDRNPGLLQFITPIPHSYPGNSILTDDFGVILGRDDCQCGRKGVRFKVLGRAKQAEIRGCGDIMAEKVLYNEKKTTALSNDVLTVLYSPQIEIVSSKTLVDRENQKLKEIFQGLRNAQNWLCKQPIEGIIGIIQQARERWIDSSFPLEHYRKRGLNFLTNWCEASNLSSLTDFSLRNERGYIDSFRPVGGSVRKLMKANPKGIIAHWLSGNVPVLGMLTVIQAMITKNANILKVSSSYSEAIPELLRAFEGTKYRICSGHVIYGDDLLKSVAVIYFDKDNKHAASYISSNSDVRLVWGGREAVTEITSLPKKYSTEDIVFGPKLSFMAIGRETIESERKIKKLIRRAATDCSVFDQTACASPHTIFVEKGGFISPIEFADRLALEMDKALQRIPKEPPDEETVLKIASQRILYEFSGDVWQSEGFGWTVLYDEELKLAKPTYSRTVTVRAVDNIMDVTSLASKDIQTVGLSLTGHRRLEFAEKVTQKGVERLPDVGSMTEFDTPWDGMFVMDRFVRWSTLGGP